MSCTCTWLMFQWCMISATGSLATEHPQPSSPNTGGCGSTTVVKNRFREWVREHCGIKALHRFHMVLVDRTLRLYGFVHCVDCMQPLWTMELWIVVPLQCHCCTCVTQYTWLYYLPQPWQVPDLVITKVRDWVDYKLSRTATHLKPVVSGSGHLCCLK